jgi:bifunctional enzyme CysN/CysC
MTSSDPRVQPAVADSPPAWRERAHIVIGGHVDHGKSTVIGRLLVDTHSLPEGKLAQVQAACARTARPFEYAFLLDALQDEQSQGITIDAARIFFKTRKRDYVILDAPGHIEFLKNMITGASRAEAALLVIDAREGIRENSRRHATMLSMLGVRQLAVLVNKMDLVEFDEATFRTIVDEFDAFVARLGMRAARHLPVSGREGDNIVARSGRMPWYRGPTVVETLDEFETAQSPLDQPFRMPVQDVYKFTAGGDDRRIVAGTIESGRLAVGDEIVVYPSGKKTRVHSFEAFGAPAPIERGAPMAVGFTLEEQIYAARGELLARAGEPPPKVSTRLKVSLFWLGRSPLVDKKDYVLKLGSARVPVRVEQVHRVVDASDLSSDERRSRVERHEVAECTLRCNRAIAFDLHDELAGTGRFVLVDDFEIRGGGIVREALPDKQAWVREKVLVRNYKWEASLITSGRRAEKYNQQAMLLLVTGDRGVERKGFAKELESRLFDDGKIVYYLGIGNVLYGVDADLDRGPAHRTEHFRRLAEVANILLDAGVILIVTAAEVTQDDLEVVKTTVEPDRIETIWVGDAVTTDLICDLVVNDREREADVDRVKRLLQDKGVIFRPW